MKNLGDIVKSIIPGMGATTCEACGKDFSCGASLNGCWCTELKLSDETRADLRSQYSQCLCRECLEAISAVPSKERSSDE